MENEELKKRIQDVMKHLDSYQIDGDRVVTAINEFDKVANNKSVKQLMILRNIAVSILTSINIRIVDAITRGNIE